MWKLNGVSLHFSGEFTLRAFLNGRLDLSQAENVGKLVSAKSMAAADAALAGIQVIYLTCYLPLASKILIESYILIVYIQVIFVTPYPCHVSIPDFSIIKLRQGGFSSMVKSVRAHCIELLTEIEARLDFDDEMPPLDVKVVTDKIHKMLQEVDSALETANYDKLLQSGVQVIFQIRFYFHTEGNC